MIKIMMVSFIILTSSNLWAAPKVLDWQGREAKAPKSYKWMLGDKAEMRKVADLDKDYDVYIIRQQGANLQNIELWARTQANVEIVTQVKSDVIVASQSAFEGGAANDPDVAAVNEQLTAALSKASFSRLKKEVSFWTKTQEGKNTPIYNIYVVYSLPKIELQNAIDRAMGIVQAKNEKQQQLKEKSQKLLNSLIENDGV